MSRGAEALLVEQTLAFARTLLICSEPERALAVLESVGPQSAIESKACREFAARVRQSIRHLSTPDAYAAAYAAEFRDLYDMGGERQPFNDPFLLTLSRAQRALAVVKEVQARGKPFRVLSIGAGDCTLEKALMESCPLAHLTVSELNGTASRAVSALSDLFPDRVEVAGRYDLESVSVERHFDVVLCLEVLEHVPYADNLMHNIREALRADGCLFLTTPNHLDWLESSQVDRLLEPGYWQQHVRSYTARSLFHQLCITGFRATILKTLNSEGGLQVLAKPDSGPVPVRPAATLPAGADLFAACSSAPTGTVFSVPRMPVLEGSVVLCSVTGCLLEET